MVVYSIASVAQVFPTFMGKENTKGNSKVDLI